MLFRCSTTYIFYLLNLICDIRVFFLKIIAISNTVMALKIIFRLFERIRLTFSKSIQKQSF